MRGTLLLTCWLALTGQLPAWADVHKTYTTTADLQWYTCGTENCIVQSFAVPEGERLLAVSFYAGDGGVSDPAYAAAMGLYSGYCGILQPPQVKYELVQSISVPSTEIDGGTWIEMSLAEPAESGPYNLQLWSGNATYNSQLQGLLYSNSAYAGGCAARNWAGANLLAENQDFRARFTTEVVPEPTDVTFLRNGSFHYYQNDGRPMGWQYVADSGEYQFTLEPERQYLYNAESAMVIEALTPGAACCTQSFNVPAGEFTLYVEVNAPAPATARLTAGSSQVDLGSTSGWQAASLDFTEVGQGAVSLYATGAGTVRFRRARVAIRSLGSSAVPMSDASALGALILPAAPAEAEKYAAYELQRCINQMTGLTPGLSGRDSTHPGRHVILGQAADPAVLAELAPLRQDAYLVRVDGNGDIILAGNTPRGTLYAVYDFLKLQGCGWYLPHPVGEVIPSRSELTLPEPNRLEIPHWDIRGLRQHAYRNDLAGQFYGINPDDYLDWCVRNRINAFVNGEYPYSNDFGAHRGGSHRQMCDHTWPHFLVDSHPEWWALVDGVRTKRHTSGRPNQLCVSNADLRDWVTARTLQFFAVYPDATVFPLNAGDEPVFWCECSACRALDPDGGTGPWETNDNATPLLDMADRCVDFANEIAQRVSAVHPDKLIEMYAYSSTRNPPTTKTVHPNVLIKYCWHAAPMDRPILDMSHEHNVVSASQVTGWQAAGTQHLALYSYGNFFHPDSPNFWYYHQDDYRRTFYQTWGFEHFFGETDDNFAQSAMLYNLMARGLWDTDTDYLADIADICSGFYGPAAAAMTDYYLFMQQQERDTDIWDEPDGAIQSYQMMPFDVGTMEQGRSYLDEAVAAAGGDPVLLHRLAYARFGHAYMTVEVGTRKDPPLRENRQAVGEAYLLARQLADTYNIGFYRGGEEVLQSYAYVPIGQVWDRSTDWTPETNPDDDMLANHVWRYQDVTRGQGLPAGSPWYQQPATDMIWSDDHWCSDTAASTVIYDDRLECSLTEARNPLVRWTNTTETIVTTTIAGDLTVTWAADCDATNVDVAVVYHDASADTLTPLFAQTVSKPSSKIPSAEQVTVPVQAIAMELGYEDEILVTMRPTAGTGVGVVSVQDELTWTVTEAASESERDTWTGDTGRWYGCNANACITQSFRVPVDHTLTKVAFYMNDGTHDGRTYVDPAWGYELNLALKKGNYGAGTLVQQITIPQEDMDYGRWLILPLTVPQEAGNYYMQVWSAQSGYNVRLHGWLLSGSEYGHGAAATGWDGVSPLSADEDFKTRFYTRSNCGAEETTYVAADITGAQGTPDCYVNDLDLTLMADQWLSCHNPAVDIPITNGDFEDGPAYPAQIEGWGCNYTSGISKFAMSGIAVPPNGSAHALLWNWHVSSQVVYQDLDPAYTFHNGYTYTLSGDFCNGAVQNWTSITLALWAEKTGQTAQQVKVITVVPSDFSQNNEWVSRSESVVAGANLDGWTVQVNIQVLGGIQPFTDNIRLQETPVPDPGQSCAEFLAADIAGPDGLGPDHIDYVVDLLDFSAMCRYWLACTDPAHLDQCPWAW